MFDKFNNLAFPPPSWPLWAMFLLGLGSQTKVYFFGCIAFSELAVLVIGPFIMMKNWSLFKIYKFTSFLLWGFFIILSLFVSSWINSTPKPFFIKTLAMNVVVIFYYVVFCNCLRQQLDALGWFFAGFAISSVITTFVFNPTAVVDDSGFASLGSLEAEEIVRGPLYWIQRLKSFGQLPIIMAYLKTPLIYSLVTPVLFAVFAMFSTISGRSASISVLLGGALILAGRKSRKTMGKIGKHLGLVIFGGVLVVLLYANIYFYAASTGKLGADAQGKYEAQTDGGRGGILHMIMSGRKEFFIGLSAAIDRPIVGFGPTAPDKAGYMHKFLLKYGTLEEVAGYHVFMEVRRKIGYVLPIVSHSHIIGAWINYGIVGLFFYVWLLWQIYKHLKYYSSAIPQWYGYFALTIPTFLWHIFFSPFGDRSIFALFVSCLMIAKAVSLGLVPLSYRMETEARKYD